MTPTSPRELRSSLNKAAYVLAEATSRHPGSVNKELNGVMGVDRRAEATKAQLREALKYAGDRLRELARSRGEPRQPASAHEVAEVVDFASGGDPPF